MVELKVKLLYPDAISPQYAHFGDAGLDVYAYETLDLAPGERHAFLTGISSEFPPEYVLHIWDRSSMAAKQGLKTMAGVIDSGYRGEWKIMLINLGPQTVSIKKGDKIAQAILQRFEQAKIIQCQELTDTSRGVGGFGSTGV